ncbi:MAG: hypothetical protein A2Z27_03875 [candidate division Zixibacteria bacterium RBG_16_50_21]|nr:MAG: hypothetical protein A2Z27_03875 [candidate division Zixibacteria bacterium RBG_16_50_21]
MKRITLLTCLLIAPVLLLGSCNEQQAVDKLMANDAIVQNIMIKMWEDPVLKAKLQEKFMADQQSYNKAIDMTLADSTMFAGLVTKIAGNEDLKKMLITQADAWKKEMGRKR